MAKKSWLDDDMKSTMIDEYTRQLSSFVDAMADGRIDDKELVAQEKRVVDLIKKVEPKIDESLHDELTVLLCELSALNTMQTLHSLGMGRPQTKFRG